MLGEKVKHIKFGLGTISNVKDGIIEVEFSQLDEKKSFSYPKSFEKFIAFEKEQLQLEALAEIENDKNKAAELKENRENELHEKLDIKKTKKPSAKNKKKSAVKAVKKENISLKCTFCDGGNSATSLGFSGVCSSDNLKNNIKKRRINCVNSTCMKYYNGEMTYEELLAWNEEGSFLCNDSIYLKDWKVYAGYYLSGPDKGNPMLFKSVKINKLAVMTTRLPGTPEKDRIIFGVFMISDFFKGSSLKEGHIDACEDYRLEMTPKEAQGVKFWKYYDSKRSLDKLQYGSGLHRYLTDEQAVQMLTDIVEVKKSSKDAEKSREFLAHYIDCNGIDINAIGEATGPLA